MWMQVTAFSLSVVLAALKIFDVIRRPVLHIHLTRDVFFRLIEKGEALFCSAVLIARNGPVLVRSVEVKLMRVAKESGPIAEKSFPLEITQFGEKTLGSGIFADHKFMGTSPLRYLPPDKPHNAVYLCMQAEYQERQIQAVQVFIDSVEKFRADNPMITEEERESLRQKFSQLIDQNFNGLSALLQLEAGNYELVLEITYEAVGRWFWESTATTRSSLEFVVDQSALERLRADLRKILTIRGQQIVEEKLAELSYPVLTPTRVREAPL